MIDYLVFILCALSLVQKDGHRRMAAMLFAFAAALHGLIIGPMAESGQIPGNSYFFTAGMVDVGVMTFLAVAGRMSRFTTAIISISFFSFLFNSYACVAWWFGWPASVNVSLFTALYGAAIIVYLWMDTINELTSGRDLRFVRMFAAPSHHFIGRIQ